MRAIRLAEPLVATAATTPDDDADVAASMAAAAEDGAALEAYLVRHPRSGWRLAVLTNLGLSYLHAVRLSQAESAFARAWDLAIATRDGAARPLADRAIGQALMLQVALGHQAQAESLARQVAARPLTGPATELQSASVDGLWLMRNRPQAAFRCGKLALRAVLLAAGATPSQTARLDRVQLRGPGSTLAELQAMARDTGHELRVVRRAPGAPVPVPSIAHLKSGHFTAILAAARGGFAIQDAAFATTAQWMSQAALEAESSGYFLIAGQAGGAAWQPVDDAQAARVFGAGAVTGNINPQITNQQSPTAQPKCPNVGMCGYLFSEAAVSLNLNDTPVGYAPPIGPAVRITISYNQREAEQPATFSYFNVGPKWTLNWLTYIVDDPANPGSSVSRYMPGGGAVSYTGYNPASLSFAPDIYDGAVLFRSAAASPTYQRLLPDGSREIYGLANGATAYPRQIFLTQIIDPAGNAVTLSYDGQLRLTGITDATGRVTSFTYGNGNPLLVTAITDPFGRSAQLAYDGSGRLAQITDELGLVSQFAYDSASLVNALTTPYGTTNFSYGQVGTVRYVQATDPLGHAERLEFYEGAPGISDSDPAVPTGLTNPINQYLSYRDTFYWDKHAYVAAHCSNAINSCDYTMARLRHWCHLVVNGVAQSIMSDMLESEKMPLESRVWHSYPGQTYGYFEGTLNKPSVTARLLDDGSTQMTQEQYNAMGNPISVTDALGRTTTLTYAANQIDVTALQQLTTSGPQTVGAYTYNTQHVPLTYTDAAGQTTQFGYNEAGQIVSRRDALGDTTQYVYSPLGYLQRVMNANGKTAVTLTYDAYARVATARDSEGWTVAFGYDALNRLTQETYPDQTARVFTYAALDLQSVKDRQGRVTQYGHDAARRLISVTDPMRQVTQFGYYENSAPKTLTDPNGHVTSWTVDLQSRVLARTYPDLSQVANTYEATNSRLHAVTDAMGQSKVYSYFADDALKSISYLNAINPTPAVSFSYDPYFPRLTAMTDGTGTTSYLYQPVGSLGALQLAAEMPNFAKSAITHQYDALGRQIGRAVGGNAESFAYDALSRLAAHTDDIGAFQISYLGQSAQMVRQQSGLLSTRWLYDNNLNDRRLRGIINSPLGSRYTYTTTPELDLQTINEDSGYQIWSFAYDNADRLSTASSTLNAAYQFGYDAAGNLGPIQTPAGSTAVTSNALNQVASFGGAAFTYDANGNLLSDYARTYRWDAENRLIGIGYPGAPTSSTTIAYDGLGRRVAITDSIAGTATQTHYGWCGTTLCQARSASDTPLKRYFAEGEEGATPGSALFYGVDQLGSVRDSIAVAGGLRRAHFDYAPYGAISVSLGLANGQTDMRYAGLFYHPLSGLYLSTFRAYDPVVGRWISRDPIGKNGGLNLYAYVRGNPASLTDQNGLSAISVLINFFKGVKQGYDEGQHAQDIGTFIGTIFGLYQSVACADQAYQDAKTGDDTQDLQNFPALYQTHLNAFTHAVRTTNETLGPVIEP